MADTFDFVIIGAGSAGCVLAARLAASGASVCVLEAGPRDSNPYIHIPAGFMKTVTDPSVNWLYETQPSVGTAGRRIAQPRGKTLGGSGSINGHIYNRGNRLDFDTWAQLGNHGWGYADVLPYFKRCEQRIGAGDENYRGRDGALTVTDLEWTHPLNEAFLASAQSLGIPINTDYNGATQEGIGYVQRCIYKGRRMSPARAFLHPARRRFKNLTVRVEAHVDTILFVDKRAHAVRYSRFGQSHQVNARREVILSGGAFNSPQILQRSGVGPSAWLQDLGVPIVEALNGVGENLRDHFYLPMIARVKNTDTINERSRGVRLAREVLRYVLTRKGLLSLPPTLLYLFWHSDELIRNHDLQITFTPASYGEVYESGLDNEPGVTVGSWPQRTESQGYVRAASVDPFVPPIIQPNYLTDETDQRVTVAGFRLSRRLLGTEAFSQYYDGEKSPGKDVELDDEILDYARRTASTSFHPMGSCKMGPSTEPTSVVDEQLRVHGIDGLRVVDASVMPTMPSANLNAPTLMIAEKAADMILDKPPLPAAELISID